MTKPFHLFVPPRRSWRDSQRAGSWAILLPLFVLVAWVFWPVTRGDFVADDYVFVATARMVNEPLAAFWQSHFYEPYYFRPLGVLSWWVSTRLLGLDYAAHSAINLLLHLINAGLLYGLLRVLALTRTVAMCGAALFALGPFGFAAALWPSNRFDLLAVGFLLVQAMAMFRALQIVRSPTLWAVAAALAALGACFSKESAFAISTAMALVGLAATSVAWRRRAVLFLLLGATIGGAFFWRQHVLVDAYAVAGSGWVGQMLAGAGALLRSLQRLSALVAGEWAAGWLGWGVLGACLLSLVWQRRDAGESNGVLAAVLFVLLAAFAVQTPLAQAFVPMLGADSSSTGGTAVGGGGPFGVITFARFYYAPWAVACAAVAVILSAGRLRMLAGALVLIAALVVGVATRPLSASFAEWTQREIRPMSIAVARLVDTEPEAPCVYVLLGTQAKQPFFRMFSDVTVKARAGSPGAWRCHVMTESTPWLFIFPAQLSPAELPLRPIVNPDGSSKADSVWGGVRYRYRLPAPDLAALPGARFFDWQNGQFVEVTADVRSGARKLASKDW